MELMQLTNKIKVHKIDNEYTRIKVDARHGSKCKAW